ncbi:MAG: hypothetical protein ACRD3W_14525, partial [Terriglobales bacterium]
MRLGIFTLTAFSATIMLLFSATAPAPAQGPDLIRALTSNLTGTLVSFVDLQKRLSEAQNALDAAAASHNINSADAATMSADLAQLAQTLAQSQGVRQRPTLVEALKMSSTLNRIIARAQLPPLSDKSALTGEELTELISSLSQKIDSAVNSVLLTQSDSSRLKSLLNVIHRPKSKATVPAGDADLIISAINDVRARFAQDIKLAESSIPDLNKREVDLEMSINSYANNGNLTAAQSGQLRQKLDKITGLQESYISGNTDGPLSSAQIYALAGQLDSLEGQLQSWTSGAPPDTRSKRKSAPSFL